jgi:hypothetical protein
VRNSILRAYGLGIITGGFITAAVIHLAPAAKAEVADPMVVDYARQYGSGVVCATIDSTINKYSADAVFLGIGRVIIEDGGLTGYQAGQVLYMSVDAYCPRHMGVLMQFADGPGGVI